MTATIFLVEDNPADVELFRMALQEASLECELVLFEDGRKFLDHIDSAESQVALPDLLILDLNLPKNDGAEILRVLSGIPHFASVPVAVLSSSSSSRERSKLANYRVREFISKPSDLESYMKIGQIISGLLLRSDSHDQHNALHK